MVGASAAISAHMAGASRFVFSGRRAAHRLARARPGAYRRPAPPLVGRSPRPAGADLPRRLVRHQPPLRPVRRGERPHLGRHRLGGPYRRLRRRPPCSFRSSIRSPRRSALRPRDALLRCSLSRRPQRRIVRSVAGRGRTAGGRVGPAVRPGGRRPRIKEVTPMIVAAILARRAATSPRRRGQDDLATPSPNSRPARSAPSSSSNADRLAGIVSERDIVKAIGLKRRRDPRRPGLHDHDARRGDLPRERDDQRRHDPHDPPPLPPPAGGRGRRARRDRLDRRRGEGADRGSRARGRRAAGPISPRPEPPLQATVARLRRSRAVIFRAAS